MEKSCIVPRPPTERGSHPSWRSEVNDFGFAILEGQSIWPGKVKGTGCAVAERFPQASSNASNHRPSTSEPTIESSYSAQPIFTVLSVRDPNGERRTNSRYAS